LKKGKKTKNLDISRGEDRERCFRGNTQVKTEVFGWARETEKRRKENFFDVDFFRKGEKKKKKSANN
jgi:hypothetical protein